MIRDPKRQYDGFISVEGGVDSNRSPSLLAENQLAWAVNATMRGGFATCRPGFKKLPLVFPNSTVELNFESGKFQGSGVYISPHGQSFLVSQHGGRQFAINISSNYEVSDISIVDPVTQETDFNSSNQAKAWFQQAEGWLVIQDNQSKPLLWNGSTLRRASDTEVPVGGPMAYGKGRLWVAQGRAYVGGDLVWTDDTLGAGSVINFTENTFLAEGGSFAVPATDGSVITGLAFAANIDTSLGDGDLLVFTNRDIFAFDAPIDRTEWLNLTYPIQRFALMDYGTYSHTSIVRVNGDLFFRSQDGIRSFAYARRDFISRWGNTPISAEIDRAMTYDDEAALYAASAVNFDNRMLMTVGPQTTPNGVWHNGLAVLDFDLVSGMALKTPPAWEGIWTGMRVFQLLKAIVNGIERCFAFVFSENDTVELWEISRRDVFDSKDNDDHEIAWAIETKNFSFPRSQQSLGSAAMEKKRLEGADMWIDSVWGDVSITAQYRPDNQPCWKDWCSWSDCAQTESCGETDVCAVPLNLRPQVRTRVALPPPPDSPDTLNGTFYRDGGEFQVRFEFTGKFVFRKFRLFALVDSEELYGQAKVTACVAAVDAECQTDECKTLECCEPEDYDYPIGCVPVVITASTLPDPVFNQAYSEGIAHTGTGHVHAGISDGALPAGLQINPSSGAIYGTPTETGTFTFTVRMRNQCGEDFQQFSFTVEIQDFIWGEAWSLTAPEVPDAFLYFEDVDGVLTGGDGGSAMPPNAAVANVFSAATVPAGQTTGDTEIDIWAFTNGAEYIQSIETIAQTRFKIFTADLDDLPAGNLYSADIAGWTMSKQTNLREFDMEFAATVGAKYRAIAIPQACFSWTVDTDVHVVFSQYLVAGGSYSINYGEDEIGAEITPVWVQNNTTGGDGYGFIYPAGIDIPYCVVIFPSNAAAHTIKLRKYSTTLTTTSTTNYGNAGLAANILVTPTQTKTHAVSKVSGSAFQVDFSGTSTVTYRPKAENLEGAGQTLSGNLVCHASFFIGVDEVVPEDTDTTAFSKNWVAGWDGVTDFLGASGYLPGTVNDTATPILSVTSPAVCNLFEGVGSVNVDLKTWQTADGSGTTSGSLPAPTGIHFVFDVQQRSAGFNLTIHFFET